MGDRTAFVLAMIMTSASGAMLAPMIFGAPINIVLAAALVGAVFGAIVSRMFKNDFRKGGL